MFWWVVLAVVVVGFALAWWTSGRKKGVTQKGDENARWSHDEGGGPSGNLP
jgi:hypothetical protein